MSSKLSQDQIIRQSFDEVNGALKTIPSANTTFSIELDADDGDSVSTKSILLSQEALALDSTNTGVVIAEFSCEGHKSFNLFSKTITNITSPQVLTLQISPVDSGDVWINTSLTITPSGTANTVVAGTVLSNILAKRARVSTAAAIAAGSYNLYVLAGN